MDFNTLLGAAFLGVIILYLLQALFKPMGRVLLRTVAAAFGIWAINVVGALFGFHLGLNLFSALTVGVFGAPGVGLLFALKYVL